MTVFYFIENYGKVPVISTTLHVQCSQIQTPAFVGILEQMVGDLLTHGRVHGLRDLIHQPADVLIAVAALVQIVRLTQHFAQTLGTCSNNKKKKKKELTTSTMDRGLRISIPMYL